MAGIISESKGLSAGALSSQPQPLANGVTKFFLEYYGHNVNNYTNLLVFNLTLNCTGVEWLSFEFDLVDEFTSEQIFPSTTFHNLSSG